MSLKADSNEEYGLSIIGGNKAISGFDKWKLKSQGAQDQKPMLSPKRKGMEERSKNNIEEEIMRQMMQIQQEAELFEFSEPQLLITK